MRQPAPASEIQAPLPEEQQAPSAMPVNGKINIKLMNATNAVVTYQVIGDTNQRTSGRFRCHTAKHQNASDSNLRARGQRLLKVSQKQPHRDY